jgi:hypothetical protein
LRADEQELIAMTHFRWTLRGLVVLLAVVTLVSAAAAVSIGLAYPEPVSSGALGPDWQCTRLALVFTSCSRVVPTEPSVGAPVAAARDLLCRRWVAVRPVAQLAS